MKIRDSILDDFAVAILTLYFLTFEFRPIGGFEPNDPNCVRDCGPHRIWTMAGHVPADNIVNPEHELQSFMDYYNAAPFTVRFQPYGVERYPCNDGTGDYRIYASIYQ